MSFSEFFLLDDVSRETDGKFRCENGDDLISFVSFKEIDKRLILVEFNPDGSSRCWSLEALLSFWIRSNELKTWEELMPQVVENGLKPEKVINPMTKQQVSPTSLLMITKLLAFMREQPQAQQNAFSNKVKVGIQFLLDSCRKIAGKAGMYVSGGLMITAAYASCMTTDTQINEYMKNPDLSDDSRWLMFQFYNALVIFVSYHMMKAALDLRKDGSAQIILSNQEVERIAQEYKQQLQEHLSRWKSLA